LIALESRASGVFNIDYGKSVTINELAKMILELTGSESPIIHIGSRPGNIRNSRAGITKAMKLLGWKPQ